jgi:hypothetical protein
MSRLSAPPVSTPRPAACSISYLSIRRPTPAASGVESVGQTSSAQDGTKVRRVPRRHTVPPVVEFGGPKTAWVGPTHMIGRARANVVAWNFEVIESKLCLDLHHHGGHRQHRV